VKKQGFYVRIAVLLIALSAALYWLHFSIFHDEHHIFIYLLGDIAFVPMEVLLVTLILHKLLEARERSAILNKLNMVIGTFFRAMGTELLAMLAGFDANSDQIKQDLVATSDWTDRTFRDVARRLAAHEPKMDLRKADLDAFRDFMVGKRDLLLRLLQNPTLLEHESFTDMLWGVFHMADELAHRPDLKELPDSDLEHLAGDMARAYTRLTAQWTAYMKHLKADYPYLFSLAMRTNPFDPEAGVVVR